MFADSPNPSLNFCLMNRAFLGTEALRLQDLTAQISALLTSAIKDISTLVYFLFFPWSTVPCSASLSCSRYHPDSCSFSHSQRSFHPLWPLAAASSCGGAVSQKREDGLRLGMRTGRAVLVIHCWLISDITKNKTGNLCCGQKCDG